MALAVRIEDDAVIVDTDEITTFRRVVAQIAKEEKARLFEVRGLDDDLESVFRYLVEPDNPFAAKRRREYRSGHGVRDRCERFQRGS